MYNIYIYIHSWTHASKFKDPKTVHCRQICQRFWKYHPQMVLNALKTLPLNYHNGPPQQLCSSPRPPWKAELGIGSICQKTPWGFENLALWFSQRIPFVRSYLPYLFRLANSGVAKRSTVSMFQWTPAAGCRIPSTCPSPHQNKTAVTTAAHHNIATKQTSLNKFVLLYIQLYDSQQKLARKKLWGQGWGSTKTQVLLETVAVPEVWYIISESPKKWGHHKFSTATWCCNWFVDMTQKRYQSYIHSHVDATTKYVSSGTMISDCLRHVIQCFLASRHKMNIPPLEHWRKTCDINPIWLGLIHMDSGTLPTWYSRFLTGQYYFYDSKAWVDSELCGISFSRRG